MEQKKGSAGKVMTVPTPAQMKEYLDRYVIGQDEAKKTLCVAVYNHYKRLARKAAGLSSGEEMGKSNVLLLGETGSGKTLLVRTLARMLSIPCHIQDMTKVTASGYVGEDVENCVVGLLRAADYNVPRTEMGIVMLDEIDKIARKEGVNMSITRDVKGEEVQTALLKIIEGDRLGCPPQGGRKHPEQPLTYVDTSNILFIGSGAFVGLDAIVARRLGASRGRIGFSATGETVDNAENSSDLLSRVTPQDLKEYGIIPELCGRLPVVTNVNPLTRDDLVRILREPKDALVNQYVQYLEMDGVTLEFTDGALEAVADAAVEMGTGARGLRGILESVMRDIMFDAPSMRKPRGGVKKVTVTADMVRAKRERFMAPKSCA